MADYNFWPVAGVLSSSIKEPNWKTPKLKPIAEKLIKSEELKRGPNVSLGG